MDVIGIQSCCKPREALLSDLFRQPNVTTLLNFPTNNSLLLPLISSRSISCRSKRLGSKLRERDDEKQFSDAGFWHDLRLRSDLNQAYSPTGANLQEPQLSEISPDSANSELESTLSTSLSFSRKAGDRQRGRIRGRAINQRRNPRRFWKLDPWKFKPTKTEYLLDTLHKFVHNPSNGSSRQWTLAARKPDDPLMTPLIKPRRSTYKSTQRISLQEALADYIYDVDRHLNQENGPRKSDSSAPENISTESAVDVGLRNFSRRGFYNYLHRRFYSTADLTTWAWVLKSPTPYRAILRLLAVENQDRTRNGIFFRSVPPGQPLPPPEAYEKATAGDISLEDAPLESLRPLIPPNMCITFAIRLLHHARQLLPQAQVPIARALTTYLEAVKSEGQNSVSKPTLRNLRLMIQGLNTVLRSLSLPCRLRPFASIPIQQEAQFEILKAMAKNQPVLPVTRRGYQGIIAVQLAHNKTQAERQWAELKAPSWPPWKQEKLGIDAQRGFEGMRSRALRVMHQMHKAGYNHSLWEHVYRIYAGWDTDQSPTIQVRTLARQPWFLRKPVEKVTHHAVWEARIRATRTVHEAWACFLSYQDLGLPPRAKIYVAMAEKLIYSGICTNNLDQASHALPGDRLEVFPEPSSARDLIYVHTQPLKMDEFLKQMLSHGFRPRGRFLALLLRNAPSFASGLDYLSCSDLSDEQLKALCTLWRQESTHSHDAVRAVNEIPDSLFSAFIAFLCKFSSLDGKWARHVHHLDAFPIILGHWSMAPFKTKTLFSYATGKGGNDGDRHPDFLKHAIRLLMMRRSQSPQPWDCVLTAVSKNRISRFLQHQIGLHTQIVLSWYESLEVLDLMNDRKIETSTQGFRTLCNLFSKLMVAQRQHPEAVQRALHLVARAAQSGALVHADLRYLHFAHVAPRGLETLKGLFDQIVVSGSRSSSVFGPWRTASEGASESLPDLLYVPAPVDLHALVRSLGSADDFDGLLRLLRWMSRYELAIQEISDRYMNGARMKRLTVVAIRVFLEGDLRGESWESLGRMRSAHGQSEIGSSDGTSPEPNAGMLPDNQVLGEAYDIVTASDVWGPWPSDEEVEDYCQVHRKEHRVL
ncbi:hypothetical protein EYZ11_000604 [Aspergillus tanneri]|uniref:Uncharacterized protein n=1 Tax=Aspergillus tanneri TaxID=1220188 RepID=A0A4S3JWN6_9EURO|nr:hypothetical protein EYZ11_000604 [Aspergillus tanneri]